MISVRNLSKRFGTHHVLDGLDLQVNRGETFVLLGPSGCGKTTLLRCLNGLEWPDSGEIEVDGIVLRPELPQDEKIRNVRAIRQKCGMVFQQFHLFPHYSVLENLTLAPVHVKNVGVAEARDIALRLLDQMGLASLADQKPSKLSGGEQQRVAIARALAMQPDYLLYDEPTSSLDSARAVEIWSIMRQLAKQGQTQVIVTHQQQLARELPCRVVQIEGGKARLSASQSIQGQQGL